MERAAGFNSIELSLTIDLSLDSPDNSYTITTPRFARISHNTLSTHKHTSTSPSQWYAASFSARAPTHQCTHTLPTTRPRSSTRTLRNKTTNTSPLSPPTLPYRPSPPAAQAPAPPLPNPPEALPPPSAAAPPPTAPTKLPMPVPQALAPLAPAVAARPCSSCTPTRALASRSILSL